MTTDIDDALAAFDQAAEQPEAAAQRLLRLHRHPAGPLVAWLFDDAKLRLHSAAKLAEELGVSSTELGLLERGQALTLLRHRAFIARVARYLGIPPITVRLLTGDITIRDFATVAESEEQVIEREFARFCANPQLRALIPEACDEPSLDYKRFMLDVHATHRELDWPELPRLPEILRWLQRAAVLHNANEIVAASESREMGSDGVDGR
jgi:transcriptional regulator with XRE-family HTH domain